MRFLAIALLAILALPSGGCAMLAAGAVGAAATPLAQPAIDRALHVIGFDAVDPAGTAAVK